MKIDKKTKNEQNKRMKSVRKKVKNLKLPLKKRMGTGQKITGQKQMEAALRESEDKYRILIQHMSDPLFSINSDGTYLFANLAYARLLHKTPAEIIGKTVKDLFPPDEAEKRLMFFHRVLDSGEKEYSEIKLITSTGEERFSRSTLEPIKDKHGKILCVMGIVNDITERKLAEETILKERTLLRTLIDNLPVGIFVKDKYFKKTIVNPLHSKEIRGHLKYLGTNSDIDILGKTDFEVFPKELAQKFFNEDQKVLQDGFLVINEEGLGFSEKGNQLCLLVSKIPLRDNHGEIIGMVGVTNDITERKRAEVTLKEKEEKYRNLFNNAEVGMFRTRIDGSEILEFNETYLKILHYTREEIVGKPSVNIWADKREREMMVQMLKVEDHVTDLEFDLLTKQGEVRRCVTSLRLFRDTGILEGSLIDITDRKYAAESLRISEEKFRRIFEDHAAVKLLINPDSGEIIDANKSAAAYYGWSREELKRMKIEQINTLTPDEVKKEMAKALSQNRIQFEFKHRRKDGSIRNVEVFSSKIKIGNTDVLHSIVHDISERKQVEEKLSRSEEKYRSIFENVQDVYFETSFDGTILEISPTIASISKGQYHRADLIGRSMYEFYADAKNRDIILAAMQKTGSITDFEVQLKNRGGSLIHCSISAKIRYDGKGQPEKINGSMHDITERKRAEELVRKHKEQLEEAQRVGRIGSWDWEAVTNTTECSDELYRIFDLNKNESKFTIENFLNAPHPDDRKMVERIVMESLETHQPTDFECRLQTRNGKIGWVHIKSTVSLDEHGKLDHVFGTVQEITDRKHAEEELRKSQRIYRSIFENTGNATMIVDENTTIVLANSECLAATGYSPEKLVGTIWTKYVAPDDLEMMKRNSRLRLQDPANAPNRYDVHLVNARGEIRNTTLTIGLIPEIHQFVVSMLDITERKQAEMAVRESEEKFRMVFENVFDGISIYREDPDLSKRILVECNDQYAALAGRSREELLQLGSTFGLWTTLEDNTTNTNHLKSIASGTTYRGSFSWIRPDGKDNVIEYVGVPITWQGKTYSIGIDRDVTERKQMEEGLRNVQKLEGLGTLAGGIAHDFNNILGIILAYNSSIKKFKDDSKNLDLATETISKAVNRGKTLVQQILTFARKTETSFGAVNVNDVAMEIVTMIYEMFPKTVICSQNFDKSIPYINADRSQLHQTLLNLCINARDAMSEGGVLTMKTRMESAAHLHSRYPDADAANYVCLEVSDTGEGMTPETQKRIFEPFFTTKGIGKGTGLGLAVVFGIVQTHKGFIDVKSEQGTGTTFKIYLPVSEVAKPMTEKEEESLEEIQGGTETLLVVEDEEMLAIPLQMALVDKGYKVLTASDGFTALKIFQESKDNIALVLTDLGLPTISGLEVCHKIKQINPKEHVILATGFLDPEVKAKFLKAGIEHFLYKPYDLTKVLKEVREVLDGK